MHDSNVIIAGANKSGTTSLFRYLSAHPDICPSSVKETDFFLNDSTSPAEKVLEDYDRHFSTCAERSRIKLEASPGYLTGGEDIVDRIHTVLPQARLVFCLRDPVSRILSYYFRNRQTQFHPGLAALDLKAFVALLEQVATDADMAPETGAPRNARLQFDRGCYAPHLRNFRKHYPAKQICIVMFDDLEGDTHETVRKICDFIGVDGNFFDGYQYRVENKTRRYRFPFLQKAGAKWGKGLERLLNRVPWVREGLRKVLLTQNTKADKPEVGDVTAQRISMLYEAFNRDLADYLEREFPEVALPGWLTFNDGYRMAQDREQEA